MITISFKGYPKKIPLTAREIQFIIEVSQRLLGEKTTRSLPLVINCLITNESKIIELNKLWRHKKQSSPIIAFPDYYLKLKNEPIEEEIHLGDMVICPAVIVRRTKENFSEFSQQNFRQQFILSFVHSLIHLYGYTHENDTKAKVMENKEKQIVDIVIKKLIES